MSMVESEEGSEGTKQGKIRLHTSGPGYVR